MRSLLPPPGRGRCLFDASEPLFPARLGRLGGPPYRTCWSLSQGQVQFPVRQVDCGDGLPRRVGGLKPPACPLSDYAAGRAAHFPPGVGYIAESQQSLHQKTGRPDKGAFQRNLPCARATEEPVLVEWQWWRRQMGDVGFSQFRPRKRSPSVAKPESKPISPLYQRRDLR